MLFELDDSALQLANDQLPGIATVFLFGEVGSSGAEVSLIHSDHAFSESIDPSDDFLSGLFHSTGDERDDPEKEEHLPCGSGEPTRR